MAQPGKEQQQMKGGKDPKEQVPEEKDPKDVPIADPPPPPHDCRNCVIERINDFPPFPARRNTLRLPISVAATPTLTLTAVPDDPDCPCEWNNRFQIAGHRIATGHSSLTRKTLNAGPSPLIETLRPRLSRVAPLFPLAGCTLTINMQDLDQTLRNGIGLANKVVMIEIGLQVRCAPRGRWRNIRIVVED